jgi:glycosyltransferase involved in cell wall biosynthesis
LYPEAFANRISVVHEGIDTEALAPGPPERFRLPGGDVINPGDEIVTFVSRSLEPYRGYHAFMRSLPEIMAKRPQARVVIVGAQGVSYGASAPDGQSWRDIYLNEVRSELDESRIIFTGHLAYAAFVALLRHSSAHVYLTYPFVLSWSMLEAMSLGCLVIGSATPPVQEVIQDGENGLLVPFFDRRALAESVIAACATPERYQAVRAAARRTAIERYDLRSICLPRQLEILRG